MIASTEENKRKLKIGVLISGSGTNLQVLLDEAKRDAPFEVVLVVSSRPDAYGIERARAADVSTFVLTPADYANAEQADARIVEALKETQAQYVVMAGYMRKVTPVMLAEFPNRVVNLHPALLPSFKGAHAIQDAYEAGVKITGVTVHFANEDYDKGPIIAQEPVRVEEGMSIDELESRIHQKEYELYPRVINLIAQGKVEVRPDGKVSIHEQG